MKNNQITLITVAAVLLFTFVGCGDNVDGDGKVVLKEPKPELRGDGIQWTVKGPVDASGNPIELEEVE